MSSKREHSEPHPAYTNSVIEVSVPSDYTTLGDIVFQWQTLPKEDLETSLKTLLKPKSQILNKKNSTCYACSPLDYGALVIGRVILIQMNQKFILEQLCYGPIKIQPKVIEYYQKATQIGKVNYQFSKGVQKDGELKVLRNMENNDETSINFIKLLFRIEGHILTLKIAKQSILPQEGKFLKFYDEQVNCIGISFSHQLSDLKKLLSNLKLSFQSDHFLKISFESRVARDLFLLELLRQTGVVIKELSNIPKCFWGNCEVQLKETSYHLVKAQKKQSETETQLLDQSEMLRETIIKDIENILNASISNALREEEMGNPQFFQLPMRQPRKTIKNNKNHIQIQNQLNFKIPKNQQSFKIKPYSKQNQQRVSDSKKTERNTQRQCQILTFKKKNNEHVNIKQMNESKTKIIPKFEHIEIETQTFEELSQKINKLVMINEELVNQNNKLKEENLKLRYNNLATSKPEVFKVDEIKEMMEKMANRLEVLERQKKKKDQRQTKRAFKFLERRNLDKNIGKNISNMKNRIQTVKSANKSLERVKYTQNIKKSILEQNQPQKQHNRKTVNLFNQYNNIPHLMKVRSNQSLHETNRKLTETSFPTINPSLINLGNSFNYFDNFSSLKQIRAPIIENKDSTNRHVINSPKILRKNSFLQANPQNVPLIQSLNLTSFTQMNKKNFQQIQKNMGQKQQTKRSDFHSPL